MIKVTVVGKGPEDCTFIKDIARRHPSIQFFFADSRLNSTDSDIYLWDFRPSSDVLADLAGLEGKRHLFIVKRSDLSAFCLLNPEDLGLGVLLEPVSWQITETFLETAESAAVDGRLNSCRDDILQSLIQASLKLQEYDQDRTNFLARAIHDFRAPLTAFSGYCALLLGEQFGRLEPEQKEVLMRMDHSAKRLSRIASGVFQLSMGRIERQTALRAGDLQECVEQAMHEVLPLSSQKEIEIVFDWVPPPSLLHFEASQMQQVLINLLENACKFTPKRGAIKINGYPWFWDHRPGDDASICGSVAKGAASINAYRLDISDSGPGVPTSCLTEIFEGYASYSGGCDRAGGGLGLAICKSIILWHQGRIWAENSANGTVFSLLLPLKPEGQNSRTYGEGYRDSAVLFGGVS